MNTSQIQDHINYHETQSLFHQYRIHLEKALDWSIEDKEWQQGHSFLVRCVPCKLLQWYSNFLTEWHLSLANKIIRKYDSKIIPIRRNPLNSLYQFREQLVNKITEIDCIINKLSKETFSSQKYECDEHTPKDLNALTVDWMIFRRPKKYVVGSGSFWAEELPDNYSAKKARDNFKSYLIYLKNNKGLLYSLDPISIYKKFCSITIHL